MWELDHKEGWVLKNWCFWIVRLEKTLENPLDCNEIKPLNPKENQPWIFTRRTDAETEAPILWPSDVKSWLTRKDPDAGKDWRQEEKRVAKDEVVGWRHGLNGHETEQTRGDTERQGGLARCSPWGCKESDTTWRLYNSVKYAKTIISCVSIVVGPQNEKQNHQKNKKDKKEQNALSLFNLLKYLPPFACHQSQGWLYRQREFNAIAILPVGSSIL